MILYYGIGYIFFIVIFLIYDIWNFKNIQFQRYFRKSTKLSNYYCPICLEEASNNLCSTKNCNHTFHKNCIMKWLLKQKNCPICRTSF